MQYPYVLDFIIPLFGFHILGYILTHSGADCLTTFAQIWLAERLKKNVSRFSARFVVSMGDQEIIFACIEDDGRLLHTIVAQ